MTEEVGEVSIIRSLATSAFSFLYFEFYAYNYNGMDFSW